MIAGLKGCVTTSTGSAVWLLTVSPQGANMRPIVVNVSVNDLGEQKFSRSKPASDAKPGDGRYTGGLAEKKLKLSRACGNEMSGASESLTRTSPKPWCSTMENGMSGWKLSLIVPKPNPSWKCTGTGLEGTGTNQNTGIRKYFHFHCIGTNCPKRWWSFPPWEIFKTQLTSSAI